MSVALPKLKLSNLAIREKITDYVFNLTKIKILLHLLAQVTRIAQRNAVPSFTTPVNAAMEPNALSVMTNASLKVQAKVMGAKVAAKEVKAKDPAALRRRTRIKQGRLQGLLQPGKINVEHPRVDVSRDRHATNGRKPVDARMEPNVIFGTLLLAGIGRWVTAP